MLVAVHVYLRTEDLRTCPPGGGTCSAELDLGDWPDEIGEHSHVANPPVHLRCDRCGQPFESPECSVCMLPDNFMPGYPD